MTLAHQILVVAIVLGTLGCVLVRPRRVSEAVSALVGATLILMLGAVSPIEAVQLLLSQWNVFLFFLGLMLVSSLADLAGIFDWLAITGARLAGGSGRRLLVVVFGVGVLLTAFLSNDATALILTPVVYALVTRLGLPVRPYVYACTFIADTASFILPVSNPINVLMLEAFPQSLDQYLRHLALPAIAALAVNVMAFLVIFRRELRARYEQSALGLSSSVIPHHGYFRFANGVLVLLAVAYLVAAHILWPLSLIALSGAGLLMLGAAYFRRLEIRRLRQEVSWSLFGFVGGLFVVVRGLESTELLGGLGGLISGLAGSDGLRAALVGVAGSALGANLINNVPAALVIISTLHQVTDPATQRLLIYGSIIGADVGPNLTTVGSLATMFWLLLLRRRGMEVSSLEYLKIGFLVTPPALLAAGLALWLSGGG